MVRIINSIVLEGHQGIVWCISWNNSGKILASCGEDRSIKLWSDKGKEWCCVQSIETSHERTVRCVKWSPCSELIASCGFDGRISIWNAKSGSECATVLEGYGSEVKSVDWSSSGSLLASCSRDKTVWIWDRVSDEEFQCISILNFHTQDVKKVKWHPVLEELFSVSYDNSLRSYSYSPDIDDWVCNFSSAQHSGTVWSIDFNENGQKMVTCSADKTVRIWKKKDLAEDDQHSSWDCCQCLTGHHDQPIYDVSWCKKTDNIATACGDNAIRIYHKNENEAHDLQLSIPDAHSQDVNCVTWNPDRDGLLASCGDDGLIKLWFFSL